jgi:hypothetical protein
MGYALAVYLGHGPQFDLNVLALPRLWWGRNRALEAGVGTNPVSGEVRDGAPPSCGPQSRPVDRQAPVAPVTPLDGVLEPSQFQDYVAGLRAEVHRHGRELIRIEQRVRDAQPAPTRETLERCTQDWVDANRRYLKRQREDLQCLAEHTPDSEAHRTTGHNVQQAGSAHAMDVQKSLEFADGLKLSDGDLDGYCQQLLAEIDRQLEDTEQFHSSLDAAIIGIIEAEYDVVDSLQAPSVAAEN